MFINFNLKFTIIFLVFFYFLFFLLWICFILIRKKRILQLFASEKEITPNIFFAINNVLNRKQKNTFFHFDYSYWNERNSSGVYLLFNKTKNKYYVGQSKRIFYRINDHFFGKGNRDIYYDYCHGDTFTIKIIPLIKSNYSSLNKLERHTIATFKSYRKGYNKTRGNHSNLI